MKFYHCEMNHINLGFEPTLTAAHVLLRGQFERRTARGEDLKIWEVEVPIDKLGVQALLNGAFEAKHHGRMWYLTERGGLKEDIEPR